MSCIIVCAAFAGNDEEYFLRGNKQYNQKDYEGALHSYSMINQKGRAVLYNMGNCAFKKADYALALVYWSRAEVGATSQEYSLITYNKQLALKKIGKSEDSSFLHNIVGMIDSISFFISLLILQLLFLLCWYLFIGVMRTEKIVARKTIVTCLCLITVCISRGLVVHYKKQNIHEALVIKKDATLFSGPDKGFQSLSSLTCADCVAVKEKREGWYKVAYAGMIGWVEADVLQII